MADRIAFVADVHAGNRINGGTYRAGLDERCRSILDVLRRSVNKANQDGCCAFVVLGDLFDTMPTPQVLAATQDALDETGHMIGQCWLLVGNHDQESAEPGDNALRAMQGHARVVEAPMCARMRDTDLLLVPFQTGDAKDWLPGAIAEAAKQTRSPLEKYRRALCLHLGIEGQGTPPYLRGAPDSVTVDQLRELMLEFKIDATFAGNWHHHRAYGHKTGGKDSIVQVGALVPNGFRDEGVAGCMVEWDGSQTKKVELPGPRYVRTNGVLTRSDTKNISSMIDAGCVVHVQCTASPDEVKEVRIELDDLRRDGMIESYEVRPDKKSAVVAAKSQARAARSADSLGEAVERWVREMELPDDVRRGKVVTRARGFLGLK